MSTELREIGTRVDGEGMSRGRNYSLGPQVWALLHGIETACKATDRVRCECGELITFDTDGDGNLVALDAHDRSRHQCKVRTT